MEFLSGSGEMMQAVRQYDWTKTSFGTIPTWPDGLRTAIGICLNSQFAMAILWGPEMILVYNDAYSAILGEKHPGALGQPAAAVWPEIWATVGPMLNTVLSSGQATWDDDLLLMMQRSGFVEECYFTFSYSPLHVEDGKIGGVFVTVLETTERVLNQRRLRALSELASTLSIARDPEHVFRQISEGLSRDLYTFPFSALYLCDRQQHVARLASCTGLHPDTPSPPEHVPLHDDHQRADEHPVSRVARTSASEFLDARSILGASGSCGIWPEQPRVFLALPLQWPGQPLARGVLLVAANPRSYFDNAHYEFFKLVVGHIAAAVAHADNAEAERQRIEALAELDRAKSRFFSNASHELRTPLALILGPLQQLMEREPALLESNAGECLEMVRRNAIRLQKLVNSLLDFASIDAGRMLVQPVPTDVGMLTSDIASCFRSAIEAAGLGFSVQCPSVTPQVLIDPEMWEKVLSNLISNAFKFTPQGRIDILVESDTNFLYLKVGDTGLGIDPSDLHRIFNRFFRGATAVAHAIEGTGIGLCIVQELVRLQGGEISVVSAPGEGTTITVRMPLRTGPVPAPARAPTASRAELTASAAVIQSGRRPLADSTRERRFTLRNNLSWEPADVAVAEPVGTADVRANDDRIKVLIVDDNEDLVRYLDRLLREKCDVISAPDGTSGLQAARVHRPDLILMDVMMPGMDGFELLRAIRADQAIHTVSVIMLSAQAEEEARLEALDAGADDYLTKPFNARELTVKVRSHVQLVRTRRRAAAREAELLRQITGIRQDLELVVEGTNDAFANLDMDLRFISMNDAMSQLFNTPKSELIGVRLTDVNPDAKDTDFEHALRRAMSEQSVTSVEHLCTASGRWFVIRCYPAQHGVSLFGTDITDRKNAENALRQAHLELENRVSQRTQELAAANSFLWAIFDRAPGGIAITDMSGKFVRANAAYQKLIGFTEEELLEFSIEALAHPEDYPRKAALLEQLRRGERDSFELEMRYRVADGTVIWVNNFISTIDDDRCRPCYFVKIIQDITDRKLAEHQIVSSQTELRMLYDRLQNVREEERIAIAREVHDQLGQILSAVKIDITLLQDAIRPANATLSRRKILAELRSAGGNLDKAIESVRHIAVELRPPELEEHGLHAAIEWHARDFERRTRIKCSVAASASIGETSPPIATALFRIYQEAMTNVLRHAKAGRVWITVDRRGNTLLLRVRDNGRGISRESVRSVRSIGLTGMRERAALIGGRVTIGALRPQGTIVAVRVPLAEEGWTCPGEPTEPGP